MMGNLKKSKAFGFVTDEYCGRITRKTAHLTVFMQDQKIINADQEEQDHGNGKHQQEEYAS